MRPAGAQGRPCQHRPVLPQRLLARGMTRVLTSRQVPGAAGGAGRGGLWPGGAVDPAWCSVEEWAARLPPSNFSPMLPGSCAAGPAARQLQARILTRMKSRRLALCPPSAADTAPAPPAAGAPGPPEPPVPVAHQPSPGRVPGRGDWPAPGPCGGRAAPGEMLWNFLPFDVSCPPLPAWGLTSDPPSCWTPPAPATKC